VQTTVKDAFANLVPNASVTVSIASGPAATLFGTKTQSTNAGGIASFGDLSIQKTGTFTLHAAVTGTPSANSNSFDITAAAPATAVFSVQPTSATAGVAIFPAVEVTVKDTFSNLVPGASVTVSLGTNPTGALLLGTKTQLTNATGIASFADLGIQKAGTGYKLHVAVTGTLGDDSTAFDISAAAPATAVFSVQPTSATAGVAISAVEVTVKDTFANLVPGALAMVSLGTNPTSALLLGTKTQLTNASGVASFADLIIQKAATGYKLHVAVTGTPGDDSTAFDITAAGPATAVFSVQPRITTTNLHITPPVEVTVKDAFANLAPGASVTIALGTHPSLSTLSGTTLAATNASGVASFGDLSINKPGTGYKLHAAVTGTPGDDSTAFDVVDPAVITTFLAAPTKIFSGGATQLSYLFSGGTGSIDPGAHPVTSPGATVVSNVTTTTPFMLKVTNAAGTVTPATATATVTTPTGWLDLNNATLTAPDTRAAQPFSLTFDPADPSTIYAATLKDGVLKTATGGAPWSTTNFPAATPALGVSVGHPSGALSIWASVNCVGKLYHSTDGSAWTALTGTPSNGLPTAACPISRSTIVLDPSDPQQQTLYVAFSQGGLFRSTDDGATWSKIPLPLTSSTSDDQVTALAIASNGTVFVGTAPGNLFHVSGTATLLVTADLTGSQVNAIATNPDGTHVLAGHADGVVEFATASGFAFTTSAASLGGIVSGLAFAVDGVSSSGSITGSIFAVTATGTASGGKVFRSSDLGATFNDVTAATAAIEPSDYFFVAPHPTDGTTIYVLGNGSLSTPTVTIPSSGIFKRTFGAP
jgi:hypothetical protein